MPIEQMNISLSPQMAEFIRNKVKSGEYTNSSEVVRDAVRRMQEEEALKRRRAQLADFESRLTREEHESIRRGVEQGVKDLEAGRYQDYDAGGLRALGRKFLAASNRKAVSRRKAN